MTERRLTPAMRVLVGAFGVAVLALGLLVAAVELHRADQGARSVPAFLAAAVCVLVAVSGASLLRSALRGRITVRRVARRPSAR